jgi:hypothetical protein
MSYTHEISWNEYHEWLNMFVKKSVRTVPDALSLHIDALKNREYDSEGNQNITGIKIVTL